MAITASLVKELRDKTGAGMMDCKKALQATDGDLDKAVDWLREKGIAKAAKKQSRIAAEGVCSVLTDGNQALVFELNCETDFVAKNDNFQALVDAIGATLLNSTAANLEEALELDHDGKKLEDVLVEATAKIGEKISLRRVQRFTKTDSASFGAYNHMGGKIVSLTIVDNVDEDVAKDISMHVAALNPRYLHQDDISDDVIAHEKQILKAEALNEGKPEHIVEKMVIGRLNKYLKEICLVNQPFVKDPDVTVEQFVKNNGGKILSFVRLEVGEGIEKKQEDFAAEVASQLK